MILKEIIEKCSTLNVYKKRCITDKYCELVFYSKDIDEWNKVFTDIFGQAIKPVGTKPTKDDLHLTKDCSGIYDNQTLFKKEFDDATIIAMFWPWQDGTLTTLKITVLEN
jgi:hypothetical protein